MIESNIMPDISIIDIENAYIIEDNRMIFPKLYSVDKNHAIINDLITFLDGLDNDR